MSRPEQEAEGQLDYPVAGGSGPGPDVPQLIYTEEDLLSDEELATLADERLIALIEQRSNLKGDAASEALTILRGEVPEDAAFEPADADLGAELADEPA